MQIQQVFPKDSALLSDISAAVLKVTQGPDMEDIERKWMETNATCQGQDGDTIPSTTRLTFYSLRGLFLITGVTSVSALLISFVPWVSKSAEQKHGQGTAEAAGQGEEGKPEGAAGGRPNGDEQDEAPLAIEGDDKKGVA